MDQNLCINLIVRNELVHWQFPSNPIICDKLKMEKLYHLRSLDASMPPQPRKITIFVSLSLSLSHLIERQRIRY